MTTSDQNFPKVPNFKEIENKWRNRWLTDLFYIYQFDPKKGGKFYIIDTPPPFTSGKLHLGHCLDFLWTDLIARFKRMQGYNVYCPQGWDVHGLPTELKVRYKWGISEENPDLFIQKCREWTEKAQKAMKEQMIMIGYMPDWSKEYSTEDEKYKALTQKTLIEMYKKGLLYRGKFPVLWCPKCKTALAKQEVGYIEKEGVLVYIRLKIKEDPNKEIVIATTRPELLPACVAVFVHPKDERYKEFVGKHAIVPLINREVPIIADEDVDPSFGTGAVYCCTFGDEQDIKWQNRYKLPIYEIISEDGRIVNTGIKEIDGLPVEEARKKIIELLEKENAIVKVEKYKHRVLAHTERSDCMSPIEFRVTYQWFIKLVEFKEKFLELQEKIKIIPEFMRERLINWIKSLDWDWIISRQRLWGCPLPFWVCKDCGEIIPAREEDLPVDPKKDKPPVERCPKCGSKNIEGVKDVLDCWVESSITPIAILVYAGYSYEEAKKLLPVSLRRQSHDIIRTWLFYTLVRCYFLAEKLPWETVLIHGYVLGPDLQKMSKSKGNVVSPEDVLSKYPVDALRYWAYLATPGDDYPVLWKEYEAGQAFLIKLWNIARFVWMNTKDFEEKGEPKLREIDKWILALLQETIKRTTEYIENFRFADYIKTIRKFIWNYFADTYLELIKPRLYSNEEKEKYAVKYVIRKVLRTVLGLLAPAFPFITEEIYNIMFAKEENKKSIHETEWPKVEEKYENKKYVELTEELLEIIKKIRQERQNRKLKVKDYLESIEVELKNKELEKFLEDLKLCLRVKEIKVKG